MRLPIQQLVQRFRPLLLVFPAVVLVLGILHIRQHPVAHLTSSDPAYAYLINGLTLAEGSTDIGHTDNPGTTVQAFSAGILRLVHLLRSPSSLANDVIANPELYITANRWGLLIITTLLVFWLGWTTFRRSGGNWLLTLLVQCLLFFSPYLVIYVTGFMPEAFLLSGGIVLTGIGIHYLYETEFTPRKLIWYGLGFGVVTGFLMVTKFPAIVLCALPLAMLPGNRFKLVYLLSTAAATVVFLLPAREKIGHFVGFIAGILTHKGRYGKGDDGFVDGYLFTSNLKELYALNKIYFLLFFAGSLLLVIGFIRYRKLLTPQQHQFRLLGGILFAMALNLLMASKHFAFHYLITTQVLLCLLLVVLVFIVKPHVNLKKLAAYFAIGTSAWRSVGVVAVGAVFLLSTHRKYYPFTFACQDIEPAKLASFRQQEKNTPMLFASRYCNGYTPAIGFEFGIAFSGDIRSRYNELIHQHYPNNWIINTANGQYTSFGKTTTPGELAMLYPRMLFFINSSDSAEGLQQVELFRSLRDSAGPFVTSRLFFQEANWKNFCVELISDTARAAARRKQFAHITCDFETVQGDSAFSSNIAAVYVGNANLRSTEKARSGKQTLALTRKDEFGGGINLPVLKGAQYVVTIWCKGNTYRRAIKAQGPGIEISAAVALQTDKNGWQQLQFNFFVPKDYPQETVKLFLWHFGPDTETVWWDDLAIDVFQW